MICILTIVYNGVSASFDLHVVDPKQPEPEPEPTPEPAPAPAAPTVTDGQKATVGGSQVQVISANDKTAKFIKAKNSKSVTVPKTVTINGQELTVTEIGAKAFTGKKVRVK